MPRGPCLAVNGEEMSDGPGCRTPVGTSIVKGLACEALSVTCWRRGRPHLHLAIPV